MIFFKAEANQSIGGGHLHRCISIAKECQVQGQKVAFIFAETPNSSIQKVVQQGFSIYNIPSTDQLNPQQYLSIVPKGSLLIFDTDDSAFYAGKLIDSLGENGIKTACYTITDKYSITTDILINTNIASQTHHYKTPSNTVKILGPKYMIFGNSFRNKEIIPKSITDFKNLFIFFGNADKEQLTLKILRLINQLQFPFQKINVVVGNLNPMVTVIEEEISKMNNSRFKLHVNTPDIQAIYQETDIAITAAGMSMWEMALYQIPQIVIASSQREMVYSNYMNQLKFIHLLGNYNEIENFTPNKIDNILNSDELHSLDLIAFKNSLNPNGITNMVKTFVSVLEN